MALFPATKKPAKKMTMPGESLQMKPIGIKDIIAPSSIVFLRII